MDPSSNIPQDIFANLNTASPSNPPPQTTTPGHTITLIEDIFSQLLTTLTTHAQTEYSFLHPPPANARPQLTLYLKTRRRQGGVQNLDPVTGAIRPPLSTTATLGSGLGIAGRAAGSEACNASDVRAINFPGKTEQEAWRFTVFMRILSLVHEALVEGVVMTKRDIYYKDPELFMNQRVVDRYIDDLAFTFGIGRESLNVVAAAKGLVTGALRILRRDGSVIDCRNEDGGILIPNLNEVDRFDISGARWVLVIEKEASFRTLSTTRYWETSTAGKGILVTAKGYPDIQTRSLVQLLSTQQPSIPIFGLMDFDPDGLGILSTYKHGSISLAHENANLVAPCMQWLGIHSSDILKKCAEVHHGGQGLLKLSQRDRRMAVKLLEKEVFQNHVEPKWRRELHIMLMLNIKAEIQIMSSGSSLIEWLDSKLKMGG